MYGSLEYKFAAALSAASSATFSLRDLMDHTEALNNRPTPSRDTIDLSWDCLASPGGGLHSSEGLAEVEGEKTAMYI